MQTYRQLPSTEQTVVKLLAVNWADMTRTQISNGLRKNLGTAKSKAIAWDSLLKAGLLVASRDWSGQRLSCNPLIIELIARELVAAGEFEAYVELARSAYPLRKVYGHEGVKEDYIFGASGELIREVRIGIYRHDEVYIQDLFRMIEKNRYAYYSVSPELFDPVLIYAQICGNPFDPGWFTNLPTGIRSKALPMLLRQNAGSWHCDERAMELLRLDCEKPEVTRDEMSALAMLLLFRGELRSTGEILDRTPIHATERAWRGLCALLQGDAEGAIKLYHEGLGLLRKELGTAKRFYPGIIGLFHILALHQRNGVGDMEEANRLLGMVEVTHPSRAAFLFLGFVPSLEREDKSALSQMREALKQTLRAGTMNPWFLWMALLVLQRYQPGSALVEYLPLMKRYREQAQTAGFAWLAEEMAGLIAVVEEKRANWQEKASAFEALSGIKLLISRSVREEAWERALRAIENTAPVRKAEAREKAAPETRLAGFVYPDRYLPVKYNIEFREQTRNVKGGWNKGKAVSLKRFRENATGLAYLSEQDVRLAGHIAVDRYTNSHYFTERGWLELIGHPHVFWKESGAPLELVTGEPELRVKKKAKTDCVRIEFWPNCNEEQKVAIAQDGLTRLQIIPLKPEHHRLAGIIGEGLEAPLLAQERILTSLGAVASLVTIHSDIGGAELAAAETVEADPRIRVQLVPEGEGLRVAVLVRPFGEQGSYYAPGAGGAGLIAEISGKRLQTQRHLKQEREAAKVLLECCPGLGEKAEEVQSWQWLAEDAESSLELLLELHEAGDKAVVEWPQGEKFKLLGQAEMKHFSLNLRQQRDWFSVSGELKLDNGEVLNMQRLLELTDGVRSRFIRLDENRFIALTDAFRKRLEDLRTYSERHGKDQRLHALALPALEEIAEEVGEFKSDAAWRKQVERLRQAEQCQPLLPSTLQAELRDYQKEGYEWLSRLAAWGVGACLADDMGLGKTLQAIALILSRAGEGPSLVIAPTSVCFNWQNELTRFAPSLNPRFLGAGDRQQLIDQLQPLDLLICSYGLLQQEAVGELLAGVRWRTIVLDEAQAIKNAATKRSQQAMALQAEFKLITTGTPVENHLGELWNLFRFVNPGLLGSLESFNRRFAGPIERNQDREARLRLKKLIQPFILRRTKSQVLEELPPRTEIELRVELSEQEASFYEALRRKLMDELSDAPGPIEDQRFRVLAAITKLRRACCNPELVAPDLGISSSKLALFGEVLEELLANHHKALVFSQFVDHLSIIRAYLEQKGVSYQYLDGQTPAAERKTRVEAFQAGQGEVFLISLKAGGVGLNLTAADYVIHMDPWWNPAVEDQASDRAHRIGQQRPVTVYRLVTKGTIEEQIVSLHRQKRDLADSLLEGGEISGKIGAVELLQLMRGE